MTTTPRHDWFGLIFAYRLDGDGGAEPLGWSDLAAGAPQAPPAPGSAAAVGPVWVHLDMHHPNAIRWLYEDSGLDEVTVDALTRARANPRLVARGAAMMLILKGINFLPGATPTEMVPLRLWTDGRRIISCREVSVRAVDELRNDLLRGRGPRDAGTLVADIAERLMDHMDDAIGDLLTETRSIVQRPQRVRTEDLVARLADLRRAMIRMRHQLGPQRRALAMLAAGRHGWLSGDERRVIREMAHQCAHYIEGLDAAQQITEITQDEILQRSSEMTERRLFSLTVITAIFLPLTFITGLLGVNLAGIPDAANPVSFLVLCLLLAVIVVAQLWVLRRKGWL